MSAVTDRIRQRQEALAGQLRDLDRQRASRLAALEQFAADVQEALTAPGLDEAQRLAHVHTAHSHLTWSRP